MAPKMEVYFPSGSNWGIPELKALNFPLQPESHPFEDLQLEHDLSKESLDILDQLKLGFGLDEDEWAKCGKDSPYKDFYDDLAAMRPQAKQLTPRKPALRSNTKLPSPSVRQSPSPCSTRSTQRPTPHSAERTSPKNTSPMEVWSDSELTPLKRQREDFSRSPSLPPNRPTAIPVTTTTAFCDMEFSSSPTASTFRSSERSSSISDDKRSEGDRPEVDRTILIRNLIKRICDAHGDCHGYSFTVDHDVETLVVPICGDFPKSIPDLIVEMHKGRRTYSIVDYEVCILYILVLVSSSINLWLTLGQAIKDEDDGRGKVWARSCPSSWARQLDEGYQGIGRI
jgi:hypothetical protein